ncbi:MAG TPA: methyltransferase domain-containing protein [Thiobacillaceae bacterium]|nr:methyltransferase domain-containing protein [Thiobacillaceae bacterium]
MRATAAESGTNVIATLDWQSGTARHRDSLFLPRSALQADSQLAAAAGQLDAGPIHLDAGRWLQPRGEPVTRLPADAFRLKHFPQPGRFFPRLAFTGLASGPRDFRPCRVLGVGDGQLKVDVNHPLAVYGAELTLRASSADPVPGRFRQLLEGTGMQAPPADGQACYLPAGACDRLDESGDAGFYAQPRLVHHLDAVCRAHIETLHGTFLAPGMAVLDLMSSWVSHLPAEIPAGLSLTGLGMNPEELEANPRLDRRVCHDLNRQPWLPFPDRAFDLVLCTASVEYLVHPRSVLADVGRVLRPGGRCVITFSDRWFLPKAIRVWGELHPFERLGLVLWLMEEAGFTDLRTRSLRGLKRPADDKYAAQREYSDPLFAVWGGV